MKLSDPFQVPKTAEVQKQQKRLHYSITPIGGKAELEKWKADQAVKEAEWQKAQEKYRAERRAKAEAVVRMDVSAKPLNELELAEIEYRKSRYAIGAKEESAKREAKYNVALKEYRTYEEIMGITEAPKPKTLTDKFKALVSNIWRKAFP